MITVSEYFAPFVVTEMGKNLEHIIKRVNIIMKKIRRVLWKYYMK